jgi:hypothetical protein
MSCEEAFLVCTVDAWICQERRAAGEGDLYPPFGTTMEWDTYCLTGECSRDVKRCLTKFAPVASLILRPSRSSFCDL